MTKPLRRISMIEAELADARLAAEEAGSTHRSPQAQSWRGSVTGTEAGRGGPGGPRPAGAGSTPPVTT